MENNYRINRAAEQVSAVPDNINCTYGAMRKKVAENAARIKDKRVRGMYLNCFYSSLDTAAQLMQDGTTFMLTGDIPAMWLRDSAVQVMGYLPFVKADLDVDRLIRGLIKRQMKYIALDPYANAFNREPNNCGHKDDLTNRDSPWIWERKYEVDSLCYPLWLAQKYSMVTGSFDVYDSDFLQAFEQILTTFEIELNHCNDSEYFHSRPLYPQYPTLSNGGKGRKTGYTGMTWNGYRPSDDVCEYGYLVPANQFATVVLDYLIANADRAGLAEYSSRIIKLNDGIKSGIEKFAKVIHPEFGLIYAYEVDGLGGINLMDDANVPSLMSLPYLGYCKNTDPVYENTRRFILSNKNPYYYSGKFGKGVGSPHTPQDYIWHIGLVIQLLTSKDNAERKEIFETLLSTDADCGVMHESFDCNNPQNFTREWFCWANTLFALAVESMMDGGELDCE